jgi:phospholipase/carboxylesterase
MKHAAAILIGLLTLVLTPPAGAQKINTTLTYSVVRATIKTAKPSVLIIMHGYGSDENDFIDLAKSVDGRFTTFSLRAPNVVNEGSYCWYKLNFLSNGDFTYNYEEVKKSREKVLSFISEACKAYKLDSTQVFIMGFSQGAIMCYELSLFAPGKIKGVLPISGRLMKESAMHKPDAASVQKLKFFIGHGVQDERIKFNESEKAVHFLQEKKASVTFKNYPIGHTLSSQEAADIKAFLTSAINQ